jgi:hypothetical protein
LVVGWLHGRVVVLDLQAGVDLFALWIMGILKKAVFTALSFCVFGAVAKFVFNPRVGHLIPVIRDGKVEGFVYRVETWWGLSRNKYAAFMSNNGPLYRSGNKILMVPESDYESEGEGPEGDRSW